MMKLTGIYLTSRVEEIMNNTSNPYITMNLGEEIQVLIECINDIKNSSQKLYSYIVTIAMDLKECTIEEIQDRDDEFKKGLANKELLWLDKIIKKCSI